MDEDGTTSDEGLSEPTTIVPTTEPASGLVTEPSTEPDLPSVPQRSIEPIVPTALVVRRLPSATWAYTVVVPFYVLVWMYRIQREADVIVGRRRARIRAIGRPAAYVLGLATAVGSYQVDSNVVAFVGWLVALFAALGVARVVDQATGASARSSWLRRHVALVPVTALGMVAVHLWVPLVQRRMNRWIDAAEDVVELVPRPRAVRRRPPRSWTTPHGLVAERPVFVGVPLASRWQPRRPIVVPVLALAAIAMFALLWLQLGRSWSQADLDRLGALSLRDLHAGRWSDLAVMNVLHLDGWHLGFNVAILVIVGLVLERRLGSRELAALTVVGAAGAALGSLVWLDSSLISVGMSGIIASWVGASVALDPRGRSDLGRIGWMLLLVGLSDYAAATWGGEEGGSFLIDFGSHLGGAIAGVAFVLLHVLTGRLHGRVRIAARFVPVAAAFAIGLTIVANVRPDVVSLPSDPSRVVEATASRAEIEAYVSDIVPAMQAALTSSVRLNELRLDLFEFPQQRDVIASRIDAEIPRLRDALDMFRRIDAPRGLEDVNDGYILALYEEARANDQLVDAIAEQDLDALNAAIDRINGAAAPVAEAAELLMARARLVEADTSEYGRLVANANKLMEPVFRRANRLDASGALYESPFE